MSPLRIGLTGGIGSGKSTVAAMLASRGALLVDTDAIAREITQPGGVAIAAVAAAFGADYIAADGGMDRPRMRASVFADPGALHLLESILHPLIGAAVEATTTASNAPLQVLDVPLLVESGRWRARVHRVWVVDCREATQITRVVARPGWTPDMARAVIAQQAARAARRAAADAVIDNDSISLEQLGTEVDALWESIVDRAQ